MVCRFYQPGEYQKGQPALVDLFLSLCIYPVLSIALSIALTDIRSWFNISFVLSGSCTFVFATRYIGGQGLILESFIDEEGYREEALAVFVLNIILMHLTHKMFNQKFIPTKKSTSRILFQVFGYQGWAQLGSGPTVNK